MAHLPRLSKRNASVCGALIRQAAMAASVALVHFDSNSMNLILNWVLMGVLLVECCVQTLFR